SKPSRCRFFVKNSDTEMSRWRLAISEAPTRRFAADREEEREDDPDRPLRDFFPAVSPASAGAGLSLASVSNSDP
ncbi:MAG: hypothetical protein JSV80_02930, partial [Acidobacteriota bacterium]